jgi:hypothetical protein
MISARVCGPAWFGGVARNASLVGLIASNVHGHGDHCDRADQKPGCAAPVKIAAALSATNPNIMALSPRKKSDEPAASACTAGGLYLTTADG